MLTTVGANIRLLRKHWGYTQTQLASRTGSTRSSIDAYEAGRQKKIPANFLAKIANESGLSVEILLNSKLNPDDYPPKDEQMISQTANENTGSFISQNIGTQSPKNFENCMQALNYAEQTIKTLHMLIAEKDTVIELLRNKWELYTLLAKLFDS